MERAGLDRTRALVVVAGILVQQRGQDCAADHDAREVVEIVRGKPLAEALDATAEIRSTSHLSSCGKPTNSGYGNGVGGEFEGQPKLQLCRQRRGRAAVWRRKDFEEIGKEAKPTLLLCDLHLFRGDLFVRQGAHCNFGMHAFDLE